MPLAETAAFMDATKRILVFSMAGGTGRSYHADLSCANTERRIHYLLEPGWRADQAIQGLPTRLIGSLVFPPSNSRSFHLLGLNFIFLPLFSKCQSSQTSTP